MIDEEEIFHAAVALSVDARPTFLDAACAGRPELRARVSGLLASHDEPDLLRDSADRTVLPDGGELLARIKPEEAGERIGAYKLLQEIGVGGFGTVWMAEQERPVRRRVALKIIKLGMDTKEVIARFEQERQALAMMDHPNIAKVFDAGATQFGRPFFVMELVRGIKITDYCDQADLPTADRLQLFIAVCHAVQHAHQKGIIHRDLKPSNVLVTLHDGVPVPKVIDFGVAKATQSLRLTELTLFTQFEQMIGTPLYMSPEQAERNGLDIDTRSDIYSLGVLLYELLTGRTPFDPEELMRKGYDEIRRAIREQEPLAPSAMLRQIEAPNKVRSARPVRPSHRIPADLDWIAMKALEKDRTRRYQTANDLAGDIRRHLSGEPIQARPVSPLYRLQRLVRRNQLACTAGAILCGALLVGFGFSEWAFVIVLLAGLAFSMAAFFNEQAQRRVAERERQAADEQRRLARDNEISALRRRYVSDVQLAHQSMLAHQFGRARRLLDEHRPRRPGEVDLRGWEWRWLWQELRGEARRVVAKHPARAGSVAFSADGRRIAVGWSDGRVEICGRMDFRADGRPACRRTPQQPETRIFVRANPSKDGAPARVAFPPHGDALLFTTAGGVVTRHDFTTDRETELCRAPSEIHDLSFSRGGEWLVLLTRTNGDRTPWPDSTPRPRAAGGRMAEGSFEPETVLVVDAVDGRILHSIAVPPGSGEFFNHARLSPDGARLHVTCCAFREPRLLCLRVTDGAQLWEATAPTDAGGRKVTGFSAMDLSPDGQLLATATGYDQRTIQIWNAETGECTRTLEGHRDYVMDLAFSPDGRTLASASSDETVRLWDMETWREAVPPLRGNGDEVDAVAFSPDGRQLITGSKDGFALLWEPAARRPPGGRFPLPAATKFAFMIPGGRFAFALTAGNRRLYIETATDRETTLALTISRQGFYGGPNFIGYPDAENGHAFTLYEMVDAGAKRIACVPLGRPAADWFAYSPQRRSLAWTEPGTRIVRVTDIEAPHAELELVSGNEICLPASFDLSGQYLLGVGPAGDARVWDLNTRQRVTAAEDYFSPFGMIVFGNLRNALGTPAIRAWVSAAVRATPRRHTRTDPAPPGFWPPGAVTSRAYSPDGRTTAVATENGSVVLFDAARQEKIATLHGRAHAVFALAFTPDGARLLSANDAIWDVATGQELVTLTAKGALHSIAQFSDDGDTLLVGSWHGLGEYQYWRAPSFEEIATIEREGGGWPRGW